MRFVRFPLTFTATHKRRLFASPQNSPRLAAEEFVAAVTGLVDGVGSETGIRLGATNVGDRLRDLFVTRHVIHVVDNLIAFVSNEPEMLECSWLTHAANRTSRTL